jgi:ABC-type nickel/cobalt efflux system permease component RcnA
MPSSIVVLTATAATVGFVHTILGPDHYLPFIVLSKARGWTARKTLLVTLLCGLGHVLSSVAIAFVGLALGAAVFSLEAIESFRGDVAAWLLIAFGLTYFVWGIRRAVRLRSHDHVHSHTGGETHSHTHVHLGEHAHPHLERGTGVTPWVLFLVFVFGPCEPLIPLVVFPAARESTLGAVMVAAAFSLATIGTMLAVVAAAYYGLSRVPLGGLRRYAHALAGLVILASGSAIVFLGL